MCRVVLRLVVLGLVLALAGGCVSSRAPKKAAAEPVKTDPRQALGAKMFVLKDARDMRLAIIRLSGRGLDRDALRTAARDMTMADLEAYLKPRCQAKRLAYLGSGRFRLDALRLVMGDAAIAEASFLLRVKSFEVQEHDIDSVILEQMVLDGEDLTAAGSLALYMELLENKLAP
ncbi:hypothetical protein [Desulfocurvus sp. DL9XJH121]